MTEVNGVKVLLDFGHNPEGVEAILRMAAKMRGKTGRMSVCLAQAGDRTDDDLRGLARAVACFAPERVCVRDLPKIYHRGRQPDALAKLITDELSEFGVHQTNISRADGELEALVDGLSWAEPGDLVVHLVHLERTPVQDCLREQGAVF